MKHDRCRPVGAALTLLRAVATLPILGPSY